MFSCASAGGLNLYQKIEDVDLTEQRLARHDDLGSYDCHLDDSYSLMMRMPHEDHRSDRTCSPDDCLEQQYTAILVVESLVIWVDQTNYKIVRLVPLNSSNWGYTARTSMSCLECAY